MSIEQVARWAAGARNGVAFTGAGISTESGIPDFRGPGGFWERNDATKYTIQNYVADPEHRKQQWRRSAQGRVLDSSERPKPNAGHIALARLEELGLMRGVITQNIDGLHYEAGSRRVLELHGTTKRIGCLECRASWPAEEILQRVRGGEDDPRCTECGGIMKRATISFGQSLPMDVLREAHEWSLEADFFLVVGSSLVVTPAADLPVAAKQAGARLVILNRERTQLDRFADVVINSDAGPTLTELLSLVEPLCSQRP